jgi:hypothetical protein
MAEVRRDECFYQNVRLPKTKPQVLGEYQLDLNLIKEHYESFNCMQDYQMIDFLKDKHPAMYQTFWHGD